MLIMECTKVLTVQMSDVQQQTQKLVNDITILKDNEGLVSNVDTLTDELGTTKQELTETREAAVEVHLQNWFTYIAYVFTKQTKIYRGDEGQLWFENKLSESYFTSLKECVNTLHSLNFVHGDFRACNVIVCGESVKLIDFEWAVTQRTARYPMFMNR